MGVDNFLGATWRAGSLAPTGLEVVRGSRGNVATSTWKPGRAGFSEEDLRVRLSWRGYLEPESGSTRMATAYRTSASEGSSSSSDPSAAERQKKHEQAGDGWSRLVKAGPS